MNKSFLHILTVPNLSSFDNLTYLANYYNRQKDLREAIVSLLKGTIDIDQIQGKKVLLKPNWVKHSSTPEDEICLRTHDNFTLAVLVYILDLKPRSVVIGDAPIQSCKWYKMISSTFMQEINNLSIKYSIPVFIKDFRRRTYTISENSPVAEIRPLSDYVIFDLGKESFIEPITKTGKNKFRVTNYDPDRMSVAHAPGIHKYCITKEFFDADIVILLPKLKTHQKTGITGALKILVGINGDKDFLPHHRIGGTGFGGDCYPGNSFLRYLSELAMDKANQKQGTKIYWIWQKLSSIFWTISIPGPEHNEDAGWYGNDTTWRMVLDLNRIAEFSKSDGSISDIPQRQIYSICDGIIGGQSEGPLNPEPLPLGIISFSNNSSVNDQALAILMNIPPKKIPLLNSYYLYKKIEDCEITLNSSKVKLEDLKQIAVTAKPPKGWINYLNIRDENSNSPY
jgi:uncharacterized protein (DUF362 family)